MQTTIKDWLFESYNKLKGAGIPSARLDAEIILSDSIKKERTYLHAHPDQKLTKIQLIKASRNISLRLKRMPIAYIIGYKEFYGRNFNVNRSTLVPRPESEDIIDALKSILPAPNLRQKNIKIVDVGTGSGCLGITAKLEFPGTNVTLIDISQKALRIAKNNAKNLRAKVSFIKSNLLDKYPHKANIIIANLPYVYHKWAVSPETKFEPKIALFAKNNGLDTIYKLIKQSQNKLLPHGFLILEADPEQHADIISYATQYELNLINQNGYTIVLQYR